MIFDRDPEKSYTARPFRPRWGLKGPHQQTFLGYSWPRRIFSVRPIIEQVLFMLADGSKMMAECQWQPDPPSYPTLVAVHGMEGSSQSGYMLGTAAKAFQLGFNTVRLNLRNCGGTEHLTPRLYHSGQSEDLGCVVAILVRRFSIQKICLAGFSLGGNICLKLASEWGEQTPKEVFAVSVVSPLVDVTRSWQLLEKPSNFFYRQRFVRDLKKRLRRKARLFPDLYDPSRLRGIRTIREFDSRYTAPHNGFKDVDDYYARASSAPYLNRIHLPTLAVHATDDPLLPVEPLTRPGIRENPWITTLLPPHGGHVGFVGDFAEGDLDERWAENRMLQFFNTHK